MPVKPFEKWNQNQYQSQNQIPDSKNFCICFRVPSRGGNHWRIFSLKELQAATNNFNYDNKLGEGGFGSVYWGQLWDGSQVQYHLIETI